MRKKEEEILSDINFILVSTISMEEKEILIDAKIRLEKKEYLPKIISKLEDKLTPLAVQQKLSKDVSSLYLKITSHKFKDKGLGRGLSFM
ncbi:bacteriocin immunity protein [Marinilactibacillus psychrotolerans]|uniref:Enterocin A Immunity n=1 Tax=Marinilactibacillus psychrotolerans 42ea TaxID=1255609 RepID=A0A1R4J119_9LACT|nr:bacteriocin immunity protein [Marinilactibacillus psychrotolerans]GEQ34076.1 hypothetical protein B795N_19580 [Marinilactibacillus psychrotolerans]SJN25658.1 hypothetical protein FM115_03455 [Marinilactibacillus psychrotolerans 42ea]